MGKIANFSGLKLTPYKLYLHYEKSLQTGDLRGRMDEQTIKRVVIETINELRKQGMLKEPNDTAYSEVSAMLQAFYDNGESDKEIGRALEKQKGDMYFKIIPLYFGYAYTIERIAEVFGVEISTIVRNKKRLCLQVYRELK